MKTTKENPGSTAVTVTVPELLDRAKKAIKSGENSLRAAAEDMAAACYKGAKQQQIADGVGKSQAWVSSLLKWRNQGYPSETAFGPASRQARRRKKRHQAPDKTESEEGTKQAALPPVAAPPVQPQNTDGESVILAFKRPGPADGHPEDDEAAPSGALEFKGTDTNDGLELPPFLDRRPLTESEVQQLDELDRALIALDLAWAKASNRVRKRIEASHSVRFSKVSVETAPTLSVSVEQIVQQVAIEEVQ